VGSRGIDSDCRSGASRDRDTPTTSQATARREPTGSQPHARIEATPTILVI